MAKLTWGNPGERFFEVGVDRGVLYPKTGDGVAWSGLIAVSENPSGGDSTPRYMDGLKYQDRGAPEEFSGTIEAYTYPLEFAVCDGTVALDDGFFVTQQYRLPFGLSYRTKVGNDVDGADHGYKIHIVYNARANPSQKTNQTETDSPDTLTFSWDFSTKPEHIPGVRPTAHVVIDSRLSDPFVTAAIEDILYGSDIAAPRLPTPAEMIEIYLEGGPIPPFLITLGPGAGEFTASGSMDDVQELDADHFQLKSDFVVDNGDGTYTATSSI
jgi:hypothetical protein